jgi:hypothetical protein
MDAIKLAYAAVEKLHDAKLTKALADAMMETSDLQVEVMRLREENLKLREAGSLRASMIFRDNVWWQRTPGGEEVGPFCPTCWGRGEKAVRLSDHGNRWWSCTVCDKTVDKPGGRNYDANDEPRLRSRYHDDQV